MLKPISQSTSLSVQGTTDVTSGPEVDRDWDVLPTPMNIHDQILDNGVRSQEVHVLAKKVVDDVVCDMTIDTQL